MDRYAYVLCLWAALALALRQAAAASSRMFCDRSKMPLEVGEWSRGLVHLDSATVENPPVSVNEGQLYLYENYFPNRTIRYIHVDNLAIHTCGASVSIKSGGLDTPGVLIVLQAGPHQEIRSVIDIWGVKSNIVPPKKKHLDILPEHRKLLRSRYLFQGRRAVNHNYRNDTDFN